MTEFVRKDKFASAMESGKRYYVQSPFKFRKVGQSGVEMCEHFEHLAGCADDICFYRGAVGESSNHPTALYLMNTGNKFGGDPAMGAWVTYGLGTVNENLPAFVVLPDIGVSAGRRGQLVEWISAALLPGHAAAAERVADPGHGAAAGRDAGRCSAANLDLLAALNKHADGAASGAEGSGGAHRELRTGVSACRPRCREAIDLTKETEETQDAVRDRRDGDRRAGTALPAGAAAGGEAACASCRSTRAGGTRTISSKRRTATACAARDKPIAGLLQGSEAARNAGQHAGGLGRRIRPVAG